MRIEEITVTNTTTEKVYICEDGKMFKNYRLAQEYEREIMSAKLKVTSDVIVKENGYFPYAGWMDEDNNQYIWCKALNENGLELLNKTYLDPYSSSPEVGEWVCFEISDDETYMHYLSSTINGFKGLLNSHGYEVTIKEKED